MNFNSKTERSRPLSECPCDRPRPSRDRAGRDLAFWANNAFRRPVLLGALALLTATGAAPAREVAASQPTLERPPSTRCSTWSLREQVGPELWDAARSGGARGGLPCAHTPVGPPPNPQIGDSWDWYIWQLAGFPVATLQSCTVRGMGDHCYIVVQDSQWNVTMDQAKVDAIVNAFENESIGSFPTQGIWDLDTSHFGSPPDLLDQDPRVYILYYDFDVASDGFFWGFDQECDDVAAFHSNECDVVYMNSSDFDPAGDYLLAVVAHEFQHLIHSNQDANEDAWVDEGMGELAMWLYGNPDNVVQFNGNPDRALTTFSGNFYDYVKTYLWSLYFYERFGGQPAITSLVANPANGIAGFEATLDAFSYPENFIDVFSDWVVANYLDDTSIGDGRYGYVGETLPAFVPVATFSAYPAGPFAGTVNHWAADYARYLNGSSIHATFDGSDTSVFRVRALLRDAVAPTQIVDMTVGAGQVGTLPLPQVGTTHDEVVMVYAGASTAGALGYSYGMGTGIVGVEGLESAAPGLVLQVRGSVSARPTLTFTIPAGVSAEDVRLEIVDVSGRTVRRFFAAGTGVQEHAWDGRGDDGTLVAPGSYFARLTAGAEQAAARLTLLR